VRATIRKKKAMDDAVGVPRELCMAVFSGLAGSAG
jgi:hypothetical protein